MAKEYRYGFVIVGDAESGTKALKRVREEVTQLESQSSKASKGTRVWREEVSKHNTVLETHNAQLSVTKSLILGIAGTAGIGLLARGFKDTVVETERLRGSLVTVTGSTAAANVQFDRLTMFAKQTPFTLDQSVNAFLRLKSLGLDPSERAMKSYGNTAAAMGKDMMMMIEAVADASTGEFERLKEFGIKAKSEGDNVTFTFQGVSTTVRKSAAEIEDYLMQIGEVQFAGAMENQMQRLPGMLSNLEDAVDGLFRKLGDTGGITIFGSAITAATAGVETLTDNTDLLYTGVELLAVLMVGRVAPSIMAVVAAKRLAIAESARYQLALASMAGVSATAAAGMTAYSAALALVGGPIGAAVLAAYGLWQLGDALRKSHDEARTFTDSLRDQLEVMQQVADHRTNVYVAGLGLQADMTMEAVSAQNALTYVTKGFVGPLEKMTHLTEGFVGPLQQTSIELENATGKAAEYVQKLQEQYSAMQMSERAAAIYNAVMEAGSEATAEQIVQAATLAAQMYDLRQANEKVTDKAQEYIQTLREQYNAMQMHGRAAAIYTAVQRAGAEATAEQIVEAANLAAKLYDLAEAQDAAAGAAKDGERAAKELGKTSSLAARAAADSWQRTHEAITDIWEQSLEPGISFFEALEEAGVRTAKRILAEFAAFKTMDFLGIKSPFGSMASSGGSLLNAAIAGSGGLAGAGAGFFQGMFGAGQAASSFMGPPTAAASAGMNVAALASNPATWAIAALAFASQNDFWKDPDGYKRSFAGMLTAPTPGAAGSTFDVEAFASGFRPTGIAHNASRDAAMESIEVYRKLDESLFGFIEKLDGWVDMSNATLAGVGMDGRFGTAGTFIGRGGKTTEDDIAAMVNLYAQQFAAHVEGLDDSLLEAIRSAGSAEKMIDLLSKAVEEHAEVADEAAKVAKAQVAVEERLMRERMDGVNALSQQLQAVMQMQRTVQMDIYSAMGATPLFGSDTNGQLQALEYQRDLILGNHAAQMKAEEELHKQRLGFAQSLAEYATNVRLGQYSSLGSAGKLDVAQGNFRSLATLAQGGDMDALKRLQGAADQYITAADAMFASSAGRKTIVAEVLGVLDSLSGQLGSAEFDPTAANQALLAQLQALDVQLAQINYGINDAIIAELRNMNLTLADLTPNMQQSLFGAIEQWIETAMPGGEAMLQALGGIKGSVDMLPLGIGSYMSQALGAMMQSMLAAGSSPSYIANRIPAGSITDSAANAYLAGNGYGSTGDYRTSDAAIREYVAGFQGAASNIDAIRQIYADAVSSGIGSGQLGNALGYSQQQIHDALRAAGIDPTGFAEGGISSGPRAGHLEVLHGTEAVIPLSGGRGVPVDLRSSIDMQPVVQELRSMRDELQALRKVVFADAQFSGQQRSKQLAVSEKIASNLTSAGAGEGSRKYARTA